MSAQVAKRQMLAQPSRTWGGKPFCAIERGSGTDRILWGRHASSGRGDRLVALQLGGEAGSRRAPIRTRTTEGSSSATESGEDGGSGQCP